MFYTFESHQNLHMSFFCCTFAQNFIEICLSFSKNIPFLPFCSFVWALGENLHIFLAYVNFFSYLCMQNRKNVCI